MANVDNPGYGCLIGGGFLAIIGVMVAWGSWYTVDQGEFAVVTRNGAVTGVAGPGLHVKVPFMDGVTTFSAHTLITNIDKLQAYSHDQQPADMHVSVNWKVSLAEVQKIYGEFGSLDALNSRLLLPRVNQQVKTVFGQFSAVEAIQNRQDLNVRTQDSVAESVKPLIIVEGVQIENIDFSDAYEQSVEARMLAEVEVKKLEQNALREKVQADITRTRAQAEADAQKAAAGAESFTLKAKGQGNADATQAQATAQAYSIKVRGEADAESIRARGAALRDNPDLVALITAQQWNGVLPTTMVPGSALPFVNVGH